MRRFAALPCAALALAILAGSPGVRAEAPARGTGPLVGLAGADPLDPDWLDASALARATGLEGTLLRTRPLAWGDVEPYAPVLGGRHLRDWEPLDRALGAWQAAGFEVVPVLSPASPWAGVGREETHLAREARARLPRAEAETLLAGLEGACPPRAAGWGHWRAFVEAFLERYDADGIGDAPGPRRALRYVQVLEQPGSPRSWCGSWDEYLRLLHLAREAAATASPSVRVLHGGVDFAGLGSPEDEDEGELEGRLEARLREAPDALRFEAERALDFDRRTLSLPRLFAGVPHAGRGHLADEERDLAFLRAHLDRLGRERVETWLAPSPLPKLNAPESAAAPRASAEEARRRARWWAAARDPGHGDHETARAWLERGRAFDLVRACCRAWAAGADRVLVSGPAPFAGLVARGPEGSWERRPAWFALRQLERRLRGRRAAEAVPLGARVRAVRFTFAPPASPPWLLVVMLEPHVSWNGDPVEALPPHEVVLRLPDGAYRLEPVATAPNVEATSARAAGGILRLALDSSPLYVIPQR